MFRVKIPQKRLEELLLNLSTKSRGTTALCGMGINERPEHGLMEFLYHETLGYSGMRNISRLKSGLRPVLMRMDRTLAGHEQERFFADVAKLKKGAGIFFLVHDNFLRAHYLLAEEMDAHEAGCLYVPGPGMEQLVLHSLLEERASETGISSQNLPDKLKESADGQWRLKYERLAGAIGKGDVEEGFGLLLKARKLRVVVVGNGRAGSFFVFRLAQLGIGADAALIIVDSDIVQLWNLDGMVPGQAVGWPKPEALATTISAMALESIPVPINASLNSLEVVDAIRTSDIVVSAVDEDSARLGIAVLAARYHLVHIDLCGGVARTGLGQIATGGDLRISIPGSQGCLSCMGKYDLQEAGGLLAFNSEQEKKRRERLKWHEQRAGSNVDILFPVIGEALQAFWSILRGDLRNSLWWHYGKSRDGLPQWTDWSNRRRWSACRVCGKQAGMGDIIE